MNAIIEQLSKLYNQIKHWKILVWEGLLLIINISCDTIWTFFLQPHPYCTSNSKIIFSLVPQFLGCIPQSSLERTQTVINALSASVVVI